MAFLVTTTGAIGTIVLDDLGARTITHTTIDLDLSLEYTKEDIRESADIQSAIDSGYITVKDENDVVITDVSKFDDREFQNNPLDADDISDAATTNKFVTAGDITTLGNTSGTNTGDQIASTVPYTVGTAGDWSSATPLDVKDALDELASRSKIIEDGGGISTDAQTISSAVLAQTTSTTFVDMASMLLTTANVIDRKYLIMFSGTFYGGANKVLDIEILVNDVLVPASLRSHKISSASADFIASTQALTSTIGNGIEIKVQWKTSAQSTMSVTDRSLIIYSIEGT